KPRTLKPI
ncbi:hypothetical protein VCHC50A2_3318B, partial [Vibrio cholerae HC-50A2]